MRTATADAARGLCQNGTSTCGRNGFCGPPVRTSAVDADDLPLDADGPLSARNDLVDDDASRQRIGAVQDARHESLVHDRNGLGAGAVLISERAAAHDPDPERLEVLRGDPIERHPRPLVGFHGLAGDR